MSHEQRVYPELLVPAVPPPEDFPTGESLGSFKAVLSNVKAWTGSHHRAEMMVSLRLLSHPQAQSCQGLLCSCCNPSWRTQPGKTAYLRGARSRFQGGLVCTMGQSHFCTKPGYLRGELQEWCGTVLSQPLSAAPAYSNEGFFFASSTPCHCLLSLGPAEP